MLKNFAICLLVVAGLLVYKYWGQIKLLAELSPRPTVESFSDEQWTFEIRSYFTEILGSQKLQLAELKQNEKLTQLSHKKILWQKLALPSIVVSVEVPVTYTYYVDLKKNWSIHSLEGGKIEVVVAPLEFNAPAADVSNLKVHYEKGSVFRNEKEVADKLLSEVSSHLDLRARQHIQLVRETAREELQNLVQKWMEGRMGTSPEVEVRFVDEIKIHNTHSQ